jgi:hypothetical protein
MVRSSLKALLTEILDNARKSRQLERAARDRGNLRLNIGCGTRVLDGWLNLDSVATVDGAIYHNALNKLPLDNGSVSRIHCEHFLEHLDFAQALAFLTDCRRVLEPTGTMRVIVPDAGKYMIAYVMRDRAFFKKLEFLGNAAERLETPMIICNQMYRMGGDHRSAWDFETMELIGRRAGFSHIETSEWKHGPAAHQIDGHDDWRPHESLYCELRP